MPVCCTYLKMINGHLIRLGFVVNSLSHPGPKTRLSSFPSGRGDFSRQFPFGDFLPSGVLASIVSPAVRRRAVATAHNATMSVSGLLLLLLLPPWLSSVTSSPHDGEEQHTMIRRAHAGGAHNSRTPPSSVFQFADVVVAWLYLAAIWCC